MADVRHSTLTGADLHEPKGVASATDNDIAQASGSGVVWSSEINPSKVTLSTPVWDDVRVANTAVNTGPANAPDFQQLIDDGAGSQGVYTYKFNNSTREEVYFEVQIPHRYKAGTNLRPHIHWAPTNTNTGSVVWGLEYTVADPHEVFPVSNIITVTDPADGTSLKHQVAGFPEIDGTDFKESVVLICRLYRDGANVADTYNADAALLSFDFHFQVEKMGTDTEFPV